MIGWMLYYKEDADKNQAYIQWFQDEGRLLGMEIQLKLVEDLEAQISFHVKTSQASPRQRPLPDFVLNRSRNAKVAEWLEDAKVRCINCAKVTRIANNKEETYAYFHQFGIPMLLTRGIIVDKNLPKQRLCGYPLVAKSVDGHGGEEVFWVASEKDWQPVMETLWGKRIVLQSPCKMPGRDLRVFVLAGRPLAAVLRESTGDFRANYSLGGQIGLAELTEEQECLVKKICEEFPMEWGGIDLLFDSEDDFYLNEVEDAVGSRSLSKLTDMNIARMVLEYVKESQRLLQS